MRYNELTLEAQLSPGQVKAIKVKIQNYQQELNKLERKRDQLDNQFRFSNMFKDFKGPEYEDLHDKLSGYINAYSDAIDKLKGEIASQSTDRGFSNLIAGIKKNCGEVVKFYKDRRRFIYAGFQDPGNNSALYAKTPEHIVMPKIYKDKNFEDIEYLIENLDLGSFQHSILCNGYSYDVTQDGRIPYIIFPVNGFKFFYSASKPRLRIEEKFIPTLFDRDLLAEGWKMFTQDDIMLQKFRDAGAKIIFTGPKYQGHPGGFMGYDNFRSQLMAIDTLSENGDIDEDWMYRADWKSWVTKTSFQTQYDISDDNLGWALGEQNDVIINTPALYAINVDYAQQVADALGMKEWY